MTTTTATDTITAHAWAELDTLGFVGRYLIHRDASLGAVPCGCMHSDGREAMECAKDRARSYGYVIINGWTGQVE